MCAAVSSEKMMDIHERSTQQSGNLTSSGSTWVKIESQNFIYLNLFVFFHRLVVKF